MAVSNIVLPPLTTWTEEHLTTLIQASTQDAFDTAFDNFISQNVDITFNGAPLTRDQYKQQVQSEQLLERAATVTFNSIVQAPQLNTQATQSSGLVGVSFTATYVETINVLGAPEEHTANSSLNITIAQDPSIPLPPSGIRGDVDPRRVVALNQVLVDKTGITALNPSSPSDSN